MSTNKNAPAIWVDFAAVNKAALRAMPELISHLVPGGRFRGKNRVQYVVRNPRRADRHLGSFQINVATGRWADFASNEARGGDIVSLVAYLDNLSQIDAARRLGDSLGLSEDQYLSAPRSASTARHERGTRAQPEPTIVARSSDDEESVECAKHLWRKRILIEGTLADNYMRAARGYAGPLPPTLGYLPPRGPHGPAMIAAFGMAIEVEPGRIEIADDAVRGVHLTRLLPDGSGRLRAPDAKKTIGRGSMGAPIVISPPNDLLALSVTEGIEDALSVFAATGAGVWAAGCAGRLPALADAVPNYIDCVSVIGHDDGGRQSADELVRRLRRRGLRAVLKIL